MCAANFSREFESVTVRQPHVEDDDGRRIAVCKRIAQVPRRRDSDDIEAAELQKASKILPQPRLVLDNQNARHATIPSGANALDMSLDAGIVTTAVVPPSGLESSLNVPP